jgi:hypothetical protein
MPTSASMTDATTPPWQATAIVSPACFIVDLLGEHRGGEHVRPVLDDDLERRRGHWEPLIDDGAYWLSRDDGMRLDLHTCNVTPRQSVSSSRRWHPHTSRSAPRSTVIGYNRAWSRTPRHPHGVPDPPRMSLSLGSGPLDYSARPRSPM